MLVELLARLERKARPLLVRALPSSMVVSLYSSARPAFLGLFVSRLPGMAYPPPPGIGKSLWGLYFQSPLFNAAGMFKNGAGYELCVFQGAGAYLGGTGTWNFRRGNSGLPFAPYRASGAASNSLGLPNDGDIYNHKNASLIIKATGVPIGWSLAASPDYPERERLMLLYQGMRLYESAGVDFLEINESCPNVNGDDSGLAGRLGYISERFLAGRKRKLPVIVKFSNDTPFAKVPELLDLLFSLGFDGVNFGNTSEDYARHRKGISGKDKALFDYFTCTYGGGVSGRPLKEDSLLLSAMAAEYVKHGPPPQEFHVIRTGGIESWKDIEESEQAGVSLNQWFTGYWEGFSKDGHRVYDRMYRTKC